MENGYALITRTWKRGDKVEIELPMEVKQIKADNNLTDNIGKAALQRGPLVYCAEWTDNMGSVSNFILPGGSALKPVFEKDLLNGIMTLKGEVPKVEVEAGRVVTKTKPFTAIPYYSWANRGEGEMIVWFPQKIKTVDLLTK